MSEPAGAHTVRQHNRGLVLSAVAGESGQSRAEIATRTGLARATVSTQVDELIATGLIAEGPRRSVGRGRPASPLYLNPHGPGALGLDINAGYIAACVVDLTGRVRALSRLERDNRSSGPLDTVRAAAQLAAEVMASSDLTVAGAALALPALVGLGGRVGRAPNLAAWSGFAAADALGAALSLPVIGVDNEANLAALAEHRYGDAADSFVYVSGEIGVGGGIVLQGELFRGVRGNAGELGHIVIEPDGPACGCGARGCLEQYAGQDAMIRASGASSPADLIETARREDGATVAALARGGTALGVAVADTVNVLDVPVVLLGGLYAPLAPWLVPALRRELATRVLSQLPVEVRAGELGGDAAMLGAAGLVVDAVMAGTVPAS